MIKPSVVLILLAIVVLMVAGFFLMSGDRPVERAPEKVGDVVLPDFKMENVRAIGIKKGDVAVRLEKKDKQWVLASHNHRLAQTERVTQLMTDAGGACIEGTRLGAGKEFELDDASRTLLTFERETGKSELYLGKSVDYGKVFLRTEPAGATYEVNRNLETAAGVKTDKDKRVLDPAYFYDLKLLALTAEDIIDFAIKREHDVCRVQRTIPGKGPVEPKQELPKDGPKTEWWLTEPEGAPTDDSTVNRVTGAVYSLNAAEYADKISEKDAGLDKPALKVRFRLKDGAEHALTFGKVDNDKVFVTVSGKNDIFRVYKYTYDSLNQSAKELKKKEEKKEEKAEASPGSTPPTPPTPPKADEKPALPAPKSDAPPPPPKVEDQPKPEPPAGAAKEPEKK